jgi:hypothetical protein
VDGDDYRRGWEWKRTWYENNDFKIGRNLFTTQEDERGGLDSGPIQETAERTGLVDAANLP